MKIEIEKSNLPISNDEGDIGDGEGLKRSLDVFGNRKWTVQLLSVGVDDLKTVDGWDDRERVNESLIDRRVL